MVENDALEVGGVTLTRENSGGTAWSDHAPDGRIVERPAPKRTGVNEVVAGKLVEALAKRLA